MRSKVIIGTVLTLFLIGALSGTVTALSESATLNQELLEVRKHILKEKKYQHVENALADGYTPLSPHIPGMGVHYVNVPLIMTHMGAFVPLEPEILTYNGYSGELIGAEYSVAMFEPEGFTGDEDEWHVHEAACHYEDGSEIPASDPGDCPLTHPDTGNPLFLWHPDLYVLHVWLFEENPNGIFAEFNPNVP